MNSNNKFILTDSMKRKGFTLILIWGGGMSAVKTAKDVKKVQKNVQSLHRIQPITVKNWLDNPTSGYHKPVDWEKKSEGLRIHEHILDYVHDMSSKGLLLSWYVQESN